MRHGILSVPYAAIKKYKYYMELTEDKYYFSKNPEFGTSGANLIQDYLNIIYTCMCTHICIYHSESAFNQNISL